MEQKKYYIEFEDFLKENEDIDPSWREFVEPVIMGVDDAIYNFIISYILM